MNPTQELFNRAVSRVIEQGAPGFNYKNGMCALRTKDGHKCAVGMLIDDEDYDVTLEAYASPAQIANQRLRELIMKANPDLNLDPANLEEPYWKMLSSLQQAHDDIAQEADTPEAFTADFKKNGVPFIAAAYELELPAC